MRGKVGVHHGGSSTRCIADRDRAESPRVPCDGERDRIYSFTDNVIGRLKDDGAGTRKVYRCTEIGGGFAGIVECAEFLGVNIARRYIGQVHIRVGKVRQSNAIDRRDLCIALGANGHHAAKAVYQIHIAVCVIDRSRYGAAFRSDGGATIAVEKVVLQPHIVAKFMRKTQIVGGAIAVDNVKTLTRKTGGFVEHQIRQPAAAGVISPQADKIGTVKVAKLVNRIHEAVVGALQARQIGGEIAFHIADLTCIDQPHALRHEAVGVSGIGFDHRQIHQ